MVPYQRPSPRMWRARQAVLAAAGIPVAVVLVALAATSGPAEAASAAAAAVILLGALWVLLLRRYRSWGYAEREDDLIVTRGVLLQQTSVVPYGRMQFIDVTAGPVDRLFGLATVRLHTAAAASDARIPGLDRSVADSLRDRLAALGEARATGL